MNYCKVYALVNPFSKLVVRTEWNTVKENYCGDNASLEDHTIQFHLGAAVLSEQCCVGLCLAVSATLPIPNELKAAIIGYKVTLDGLKESSVKLVSNDGFRYCHGGAIGIVLNNYCPSIEVEGPDRDEAVSLAFAILEGTAVRMTTTLQPPQEPPVRTTALVTEVATPAHLRDLPTGTDTPMDAMRLLCR